MSDGLKEDQSFRERLKKSYRLTISNFETFQELRSYKINLLNVYIAISSLILITALLIISLIVFTPVKKLIPGYGDIEKNTKFLQLQQDIQSLELSIIAQEEYNAKLRKLLTADGTNITEDNSSSQEQRANPGSVTTLSTASQDIKNFDNISFSTSGFIAPLNGRISASFSESEKHYGCDIIAPSDSPIKSLDDGIVIFSGWTLETGYTLGIQHDQNVITFYKHNSSLLKEMGDYVRAGEAIAIIGNTGTLTSGPHLHFEFWLNGKAMDPEQYVSFSE